MGFPSRVEIVVLSLRKTGVIENNECLCTLLFEFKANNGVDARSPSGRTPGLDDALIWDELDIATEDSCAKHGKGTASFRVNIGGLVRESGELLGIEKDAVDARKGRFENDFLVQGCAGVVGGRRGRGRLIGLGEKGGTASQRDESADRAEDNVATRKQIR